ncbi:hypothetical protein AQUCO_06900027v1 [Aquilegia coerulea]|uniref:F-box domain-containing protein n=1 Tax=Aquilegia coerulea TaxID=218851 RepID=A0A2G5CB11_AQUCA|nr:hypothetical protein AQUCO_06900027v1 [Aquilegia coerulea]
MDVLPEAMVQNVLSYMNNAKDVAICNSVSKRWKELTPFIRKLYFPRNSFDNINIAGENHPDTIIFNLISTILRLEELVVYCPFSVNGLKQWLLISNRSLRHLELRMDSLSDKGNALESPSKLDCLDSIRSLESLKLWGVLMNQSPKWVGFEKLTVLEIVGARLKDEALSDAIRACPNLTSLSLLGCDGVRSVSFDLEQLVHCRLDFYGLGNCSLYLKSPKIQELEVQGCSWIQVNQTDCLKSLSISNNAGRVYRVVFGKLPSLEFLSIRGVQWCWDAVSTILKCATEVKQLIMKIEFTGDFETLQPFPEIDLVEFFNGHRSLQRFEMHGALFAALCQKNSLRRVDSRFVIPNLEEVVITVRSPLNAEQKMNTLESLLKYGKNLKRMAIRILQMKNTHNSADDFFEEICRFRYMNPKIVSIE